MTPEEYNREIEFIFNQFPSYQRVGKIAYKPGIETMQHLDRAMGFPHTRFSTIHIAGTNGKGSTSHMIAAALSVLPKEKKEPGHPLKVGLYTSPHLLDFRERIKVSSGEGFQMVSKEFVYSFICNYKSFFLEQQASFFEITTALAFAYFANQEVDIAVIECGLGGRLDSTNIITPVLSVITNIGLDHCEYLGYTLEAIAGEKAGIIKPGIPVVIGEKSGVEKVFEAKAAACGSPLVFAEEQEPLFLQTIELSRLDLPGDCQQKNIRTVMTALETLFGREYPVKTVLDKMDAAIASTARITGLHGRWEKLCQIPRVICDTGHNAHGFKLLGKQICHTVQSISSATGRPYERLVMVFGVVADKDLPAITEFLPDTWINAGGVKKQAYYYFVNARGTRALPAKNLEEKMKEAGFSGEVLVDGGGVAETLAVYFTQKRDAADFVFIGGSTFVVAEALTFFDRERE